MYLSSLLSALSEGDPRTPEALWLRLNHRQLRLRLNLVGDSSYEIFPAESWNRRESSAAAEKEKREGKKKPKKLSNHS